ncbi:hypothetical protein [Streptomyces sp. KM273126]|nr:hypothetical protein [Streptomyces sp. KM273126]
MSGTAVMSPRLGTWRWCAANTSAAYGSFSANAATWPPMPARIAVSSPP